MKQVQIKLLPRKDLDLGRWNNTVQRAPYGLSWWLDAVTEKNWYGLVLNDYQAVMPLPVHYRFGPLKLINGAPFTQHQGPFGQYNSHEFSLMLAGIPMYWYIRKLSLYPPLADLTLGNNWKTTSRTNHELSLNQGYEKLLRGYRKDTRRKLRDFTNEGLKELPLNDFLAFYKKEADTKFKLNGANFKALQELTASIIRHKAGNCYHLTNEANQTIAVLFLVRYGKRIYNLLAASSPQGFSLHGMARLLDGVIRENAETDTILDFEGSDLSGVAMFFRGFGAKPVNYVQLGQ